MLPAAQKDSMVAAKIGLEYCNRLFDIKRQKQLALPKSIFGQAVTYCLNQWEHLANFLLDARLYIDTNSSKCAIRRLVNGRKNGLFANTPKGARSNCRMPQANDTLGEP